MDASQKLAGLAQRRAELVGRCDAQRAELSEICQAWRMPLAIVDRGVVAWHFAKKHRALVAGLGVMLAVMRPIRTLKWLQRGWTLWRTYRSLVDGKPGQY